MTRRNLARGEEYKRGRRFSVYLRDSSFEVLRRKAIAEQRSVAAMSAQIIEEQLCKEERSRKRNRVSEDENERSC